MRERFTNEQVMILMIVGIICLTVAACVVGGIYVGKAL